MEHSHRIQPVRFDYSRWTYCASGSLGWGVTELGVAATVASDNELHQTVHTYQIVGLVVLITLAALVIVGSFWNRRLVAEIRSRGRAEQLLVKMTDHLTTGVFQFKVMPDGRQVRTFMNKKARQMVRIDSDCLPEKRSEFFDMIHPEDLPRVKSEVRTAIAAGTSMSASYRYRFPNDEWGWVIGEASVYKDEEGASVWSGYLYDLTSERSLNEALNKSLLAKDDFLARAGHELRTPVQNLLLGVEALKRSELNADQDKLLNLTDDAVRGLAGQVDDLLDLSRIEAHEIALEESNIELRALLTQTTDKFEACALKKGLRLVSEVENSVPAFIHCDPVRLKQILSNLLSNGFKYTDSGFVRIAVQVDEYLNDPEISGRSASFPRDSRGQGVRLKFLIQDSGAGVPADQLEGIFEPFAKGGAGNRIRSGLGLTICERLSLLMGGRITVRSKLAIGTTFELLLPVYVASAPDMAPQPFRGDRIISPHSEFISEQPAVLSGDSRPILMVDDNRLARVMTSSLLADSGFDVHQAADKDEAMELYAQNSYQAIVTDYRMPEYTGTDLALGIRECSTSSRPAPILLLLTAGITDEEMATARNVFDGVLMKPVSTVQLVKTIRAMEHAAAR